MWFPDLEIIKKSNKKTAFILLAVHELFDVETIDSYRPRLHNIQTLIRELRNIAIKAIKLERWKTDVEAIQEELEITFEHYKSLLPPHSRLDKSISYLCSLKNFNEIVAICNTIEDIEFDEIYNESLEKAIQNLPHQKDFALKAVRNFASSIIRNIPNRSDFLYLSKIENFSKNPQEIKELIKTHGNIQEKEYICILPLKGKIEHLRKILQNHKNILIKEKLEESSNEIVQDFVQKNLNNFFVELQNKAPNPFLAAKQAFIKLRPTVDIFNLYENSDSLVLSSEALICDVLNNNILKIFFGESSFKLLRPRKRSQKLTKKIVDKIKPEQLGGQILNALELHSLAHSSIAPRVRLTNLWSAMECLVSTHHKQSQIDKILEIAPPLIAWKRISKIVSYLAINLNKFQNSYGTQKVFKCIFQNSTDKYINPADVFLLLTKPNPNKKLKTLLKTVAGHPLLTYRLFRNWKMLSNPSQLAQDWKISRRGVEWHIRRIYRARNLTIHYGEEVDLTGELLDILQYYFTVTVTKILMELASHPEWTVSDTIYYIKKTTENVFQILQESPSKLKVGDFINSNTSALENTTIWN